MKITEAPRIPFGRIDYKKPHTESFLNLPDPESSRLRELMVFRQFERGSTLFMEGQPVEGAYLLLSGRVKLSTYSEEGRAVILGIAEPGELLGLSANISGQPHETTAYVTQSCLVGFISRSSFLDLISQSTKTSANVLRQLSNEYLRTHQQVCALGLSISAAEKLIRLILQWCDRWSNGGPIRILHKHTHGEIAEMIGTSRETVTRLLKDFRNRGLITFSNGEVCVPDRTRLFASINSRARTSGEHV